MRSTHISITLPNSWSIWGDERGERRKQEEEEGENKPNQNKRNAALGWLLLCKGLKVTKFEPQLGGSEEKGETSETAFQILRQPLYVFNKDINKTLGESNIPRDHSYLLVALRRHLSEKRGEESGVL